MGKLWLMAVYTYRRQVRSGTFLVLTFLVPVFMLIIGFITYLQNTPDMGLSPIGVVNEAAVSLPDESVTRTLAELDEVSALTVLTYANVESAQAAYVADEIDGYLLIPAGYGAADRDPQGGSPPQLTFYGATRPNDALEDALSVYLRQALLPDAEPWVWARLADVSDLVYVVPPRNLTVAQGIGLFGRIMLPMGLAIVFAFLIFTGANQMGPVVVQEKEKRALEMVITSMTPRQLVTGKVLGMTFLSLTQIGIWLLGGLVALLLASRGAFDLRDLSVPWGALGWGVALSIPGYFLFAMLAAGLGILAGSSRQAQQLSGVLGLFAIGPLWAAGALVGAPNSPVAVALTLFPLTAPITALFRMALGDVPLWQLLTALGLLWLSLWGAIWLVARIFRSSMLLYGQQLRPRQVIQALREA